MEGVEASYRDFNNNQIQVRFHFPSSVMQSADEMSAASNVRQGPPTVLKRLGQRPSHPVRQRV
jgi:hypothetical protein